MSTSTPVPADRPPLVPPEEQFWQRYSAHNVLVATKPG